MAGYIIGNQSPKAGETNYYEINNWTNLLNSFGMNDDNFLWYIHMKKNGNWKDITTTPKKGKKVPYSFGEALIGTEVMLKVYEVKKGIFPEINHSQTLIGELKIVPSSSKTPKIEKVVLFNRGAKDVNKASYMDTLIAQAHCVAMFNQEIEFHLWEDDAPGGGHNAEINKNNRFNTPFKARVNEKGIAEASIPLSTNQSILKEIANKYMMKGDKSEGANHEYYVTASYSGKIQGASQVNVDVANPDYKKSQPPTKPKDDTPKFPASPGGKKQPDPQGNILEALFINNEGKELSQIVVGGQLRIRIHSKNMVGKAIQYVIWEHDSNMLGVDSHDEIFRSGRIKLDADVFDTAPVTISEALFNKGIDLGYLDSDKDNQSYFIEIIPLDASAESKKFGLTDEKQRLEVLKSMAVVNGNNAEKKNSSCICKQYDLIWGEKVTCGFRKKVVEISKELWPQNHMNMANNLMAIMALETDKSFNPKTENKNGYFGLTGFGNSTVEDFQRTLDKTITKQKILNCTAEEQLYYVKERLKFVQKYLMNNGKGGTLSDFTDLYLAILYPAKSGLLAGEDAKQKIIFDASKGLKYELEYRQNPSFMHEEGEWENKVSVTFTRKGKQVTEKLRGYGDLYKAKTYRWEVTEEISNYKDEGNKYKASTFSCTETNISKKSEKKDSKWHDPVDNPQLCLYTQKGNYRPRYNVFGKVRKERDNPKHQGIDFLALPGSKVYACVDAFIEFIEIQSGYGNVICLKVKDKEAFLKRKRDFNLAYSAEGEILEGSGFDYNGEIYLFYAHLQQVNISVKNKEVKCGDPIALNGTSGYGSTRDPHLHFEIRNKARAAGLNNRCHPGIFVYYKGESDMSQAEKDYHKKIAEKEWD